MTEQDNFSV